MCKQYYHLGTMLLLLFGIIVSVLPGETTADLCEGWSKSFCDQMLSWVGLPDSMAKTTTSPLVLENDKSHRHEKSTDIGIDSIDGLPAAFVDFNADRLVDILLINNFGKNLVALKGQICYGQY